MRIPAKEFHEQRERGIDLNFLIALRAVFCAMCCSCCVSVSSFLFRIGVCYVLLCYAMPDILSLSLDDEIARHITVHTPYNSFIQYFVFNER